MDNFKIGLDFDEQSLLNALNAVGTAADKANEKWERLNKTVGGGNGGARTIGATTAATNTGTASLLAYGKAAGIAFAGVNLLVDGIKRVASGTFDFIKGNITLAASMESVQTNFTTYLKSADKAKLLLKELGTFAADTPFTQADVFGNAEKLLGFGFAADEVTDTIKRLGDISGGSSEKLGGLVLALGQVRAKQRVQGEELLQFAERGVPIYEALAKAIGKSVPETQALVTKGVVGFGDLQKAIKLLTDEGGQFNGVLQNQSKTFNGLVSTLEGDFEQLRAAFGAKLLPLLKDVVQAADDLIRGINVDAAVEQFAKIGEVTAPIFDAIKTGLKEDVVPALIVFRDEVKRVIDRISEYVDGTGLVETSANVISFAINAISTAFSHLVRVLSNATTAAYDFIEPIVAALTPSVNTVVGVLDGLVDKFGDVSEGMENTGSAFSTAGKIIGSIVSVIANITEVMFALIAGVTGTADSVKSADPVINNLAKTFEYITGPLRELVAWVTDGVVKLGQMFGLLESAQEKSDRLQQEADRINALNAERRRQLDLEGREEENAARRADAESKNFTKRTDKKIVDLKAIEKAQKDALKAEQERQKIRISLIQDETEKTLAEETARYDEQVKEITRLFTKKKKITEEGNRLLDLAAKQHAANIDAIEGEAFTKEQEVINQRIENEKKFTESYLKEKERQLVVQKNQDETAVQISEEQTAAYLLRLEQQGASEEDIKLLQEEFDLQFKRRRLTNEIKFQEALLLTLAAGDEERRKEVEQQIKLLKAQLDNVTFEIENPDPVKANKLLESFKKLKKDIAESLGITPEELGPIVDSAIGAFSSLYSAINELNQAEIDSNQRLIDSIKSKVSEQEKAVEKERAFAEDGKANNLKTEQDKLDGLLAQQEEFEKKGQELREKAAKRELAANIASQIANTGAAVAKIFNANAGIPILGAVLAGIQIAAMFATIAAARQKAKAAATEKLFTGGMLPFGKSDENGGTGYKIQGTNFEVGGGEFILNRKVTQRHLPFVKALNDGAINATAMYEDYTRRRNGQTAYYRQAADMVDSVNSSRTADQTNRMLETMNRNHEQVMRNGFARLQELGFRIVDKDGNIIHFSTDPAGNKKTSKEKYGIAS